MLKALFFFLVLTTSGPSFAQDIGRCYDSASQKTRLETGVVTPTIDSMPRNHRHWLAMKASELVYKLSDLEMSKTGADLVKNFAVFRSSDLPSYVAWKYFSDRTTGLKYAIFAPINVDDPWIFAFAGTQSTLDWLSDASLGRVQLQTVEALTALFTECRNTDRVGVPIAARNWIITGHSLGGGLAQAFGFQSRARRLVHRLTPGRLELVTFNGFGALDLVGSFAPFAQTETMQLQTANYFVTGDLISRIGRHIGDTYEIPLPRGQRTNILHSHVMTTVDELVMATGEPRFDLFAAAAPPASQTLQVLKSVGTRLEFLTEIPSEKLATQMEQARVLHDAIDIVQARGAGAPYDAELVSYLREISSGFIVFLRSKPKHPLREELIEDLLRMRAHLSVSR